MTINCMRILRILPIRMFVLYVSLTYLYLSGFFFRQAFAKGPIESIVATIVAVAMMLILYSCVVFFIERRDVSELALKQAGRELVLGLGLGFGLYSFCILIIYALGFYNILGVRDWHVLLGGVATALATGVFEELWFRGAIFRLTEEWFGTWIALFSSSIIFGVSHADADGATLQGILSISIWAGMLLAATYILTRRLWLGIGLHTAWNYTQGTIYSGVVSGNNLPTGFIETKIWGAEILTGGSFGLEGSIIVLIVCTLLALFMLAKSVLNGSIQPPYWVRK